MKKFFKGFVDAHKTQMKEIKENWILYLVFMLLVTIHSLITKIDPYLSGAILFVSFITAIVITGIVAFVRERLENKNPH